MELIDQLSAQLGISRRQAAGGAGLLLEFVQQRLEPEDFVLVADAVPAISDIIGKAPRIHHRQPRPLREELSRWFGGLGGLADLVWPFETLGCNKTTLVSMVGALVGFFHEKGGDEVASLLEGVLR
ncbi:MAG: DUF2780 domain-containing protein [Pirellulales bacterium]|nr:DUF2780 domain-containing protein [Pirellulales bacterium]